MKRWLILIACLLGALVCYTIGFAHGIYIILGVGVALELAFWIKLIKKT